MQIYRSAHVRAFTVMANAAIQDNRMSFEARGVLAYLLSRFDGERFDVRKLAALSPTGRKAVQNALNELKEFGYYAVWKAKCAETGRFVTHTALYENPEDAAKPQVAPAAGERAAGGSGRKPKVFSTGEKTPPSPGGEAVAEAEAPGAVLGDADAALLRRIARIAPQLTVGVAEAAPLVPLFARWRERGATDGLIAGTLTGGLPDFVAVPAKFLLSRLERKMPPEAVRGKARSECRDPDCGRPLAAGVTDGLCGRCPGSRPVDETALAADEARRAGVALVRAAMAESQGGGVWVADCGTS